MTPYKEFGAMVATARKARALSRLEVANKLCVHPSFYAKVENGLRTVSVITLALMWRHIKIDANAVLETLPVEIAPRGKRKRHHELTARSTSLAELAGVMFDFDRLMARARYDAGLTLAELASAVDLSKRQIGRIEGGHGLPSLPAFARLHRVLGFDANHALASLLGDKVPIKSPDRMRGATHARLGGRRGPPAAHCASSRLWRGGPQLSLSVRDTWLCQCHKLRVIVPGLTGMDTNEVPERRCIGYTPQCNNMRLLSSIPWREFWPQLLLLQNNARRKNQC